jgi:hypothetical protein
MPAGEMLEMLVTTCPRWIWYYADDEPVGTVA